MKPEKAARISSYIARNSARVSIMSRDKGDLLDYYEKQKYAEYVISESAGKSGENIAKRSARMQAQKQNTNGWKALFSRKRKGALSGLSLGLIIIMIVFMMHLMS